MDSKSNAWASSVAAEAIKATTFSVGLIGGQRSGNDRRVIDKIAKSVATEVSELSLGGATLLLRLLPEADVRLVPAPQASIVPAPEKSPLGPWYEVALPVPFGKSAPWTVERLPQWLQQWRQQHRMVLVDLGPIHTVASRVVARLCDISYILLGPATCASHEWIVKQIAMHERSGTVLAGSVVANVVASSPAASAA